MTLTETRTLRETELLHQAQAGSNDAKAALINMHRDGIVHLAICYARRTGCRWQRNDFDDLYQCGCIGMLEAIKRYDFRPGVKFFTYACWWIRNKILNETYKNDLIVVPKAVRPSRADYKVRARNIMTLPSDASDSGAACLIDKRRDGKEDVDDEEAASRIKEVIRGMPERYRVIARMVIMEGATYSQCGKVLGVSRERVRQMLNRMKARVIRALGIGDAPNQGK